MFYLNGSNITGSVSIVDDDFGLSAESTTGVSEDNDYIIVVWDGDNEDTIPANSSATYKITGVPRDFNGEGDQLTNVDSVGIKFTPDTSTNPLDGGGYNYLNSGSTFTNIMKLYSVGNTSADTGSASAEAANLIWSDGSAVAHDATVSEASTNDWTNSYLLNDLTTRTLIK